MKQSLAQKLQVKSGCKTEWTTAAGSVVTTEKAETQFSFLELHENRVITWSVHLTPDINLGRYDMILGRDALQALGIDIKYSSATINWENAEVPMRHPLANPKNDFFINEDGTPVKSATDRISQIVAAKYEKADLEQVVQSQNQLTDVEKSALLKLLYKYENLFDGTLGKWEGSPYNIELKPNALPYHGA